MGKPTNDKKSPKQYQLTKEEQARLAQVGEIFGALSSWQNLLGYLTRLVENDRQMFVDKVVRPRLELPEIKEGDQPDIRIDVQNGIVEKL